MIYVQLHVDHSARETEIDLLSPDCSKTQRAMDFRLRAGFFGGARRETESSGAAVKMGWGNFG